VSDGESRGRKGRYRYGRKRRGLSAVNRLEELFRRAASIHRTEGLLPLTKRATAYAVRRLFRYETYYLYEGDSSTYKRFSDTDFVPKVDGLSFRVVHTNEEADELEAQGFQFGEHAGDARSKLNNGAIAFCVFVGHELANVGWLCTTQQAKDSLDEPPVRVDFSNGETWTGGFSTNPRYRRMGLHTYCILEMIEYWLQKGIVKSKWAVAKRNFAALTAESKIGSVIYGEGRLIKVLWWKSWKERPLPLQQE